MTDRPIIFSAPMVRALLDGRKTQTRRVLKPQPTKDGDMWFWGDFAFCDRQFHVSAGQEIARKVSFAPCDRLWVREAHAIGVITGPVWYRQGHEEARAAGPRVDVKWRPSIHMPRWASRLTLIVESLKVERLQDISEEDAKAEGVREIAPPDKDGMRNFSAMDAPGGLPTARLSFFDLWATINGMESCRANPWVAAISFRVIKANIDRACA